MDLVYPLRGNVMRLWNSDTDESELGQSDKNKLFLRSNANSTESRLNLDEMQITALIDLPYDFFRFADERAE